MIVAQRKGKHHEMAFEIGKTNDRKGKMYRAVLGRKLETQCRGPFSGVVIHMA